MKKLKYAKHVGMWLTILNLRASVKAFLGLGRRVWEEKYKKFIYFRWF